MSFFSFVLRFNDFRSLFILKYLAGSSGAYDFFFYYFSRVFFVLLFCSFAVWEKTIFIMTTMARNSAYWLEPSRARPGQTILIDTKHDVTINLACDEMAYQQVDASALLISFVSSFVVFVLLNLHRLDGFSSAINSTAVSIVQRQHGMRFAFMNFL